MHKTIVFYANYDLNLLLANEQPKKNLLKKK